MFDRGRAGEYDYFIPPAELPQELPLTVRITISLPDGLAEMVERLVAEGRYATASDVIRDGLRALEKRQEEHEERLAHMRAELQARLEGESVSHEEMSRRVEKMLAEKARRRESKSA